MDTMKHWKPLIGGSNISTVMYVSSCRVKLLTLHLPSGFLLLSLCVICCSADTTCEWIKKIHRCKKYTKNHHAHRIVIQIFRIMPNGIYSSLRWFHSAKPWRIRLRKKFSQSVLFWSTFTSYQLPPNLKDGELQGKLSTTVNSSRQANITQVQWRPAIHNFFSLRASTTDFIAVLMPLNHWSKNHQIFYFVYSCWTVNMMWFQHARLTMWVLSNTKRRTAPWNIIIIYVAEIPTTLCMQTMVIQWMKTLHQIE